MYDMKDWIKVCEALCYFLKDKPEVEMLPDNTKMEFSIQILKAGKDEFSFNNPVLIEID